LTLTEHQQEAIKQMMILKLLQENMIKKNTIEIKKYNIRKKIQRYVKYCFVGESCRGSTSTLKFEKYFAVLSELSVSSNLFCDDIHDLRSRTVQRNCTIFWMHSIAWILSIVSRANLMGGAKIFSQRPSIWERVFKLESLSPNESRSQRAKRVIMLV
jgi:hypothetical protein